MINRRETLSKRDFGAKKLRIALVGQKVFSWTQVRLSRCKTEGPPLVDALTAAML